MGFSVENEIVGNKNLVKFTFEKDFTKEDFSKFLGILTKLLDSADKTGNTFGFYVDTTKASIAPVNAAQNFLAWKRKETPRIKNNKKLLASAVCVKSSVISNLVNTALKISPTVTPNLITSDIEKAKNFVCSHLEKTEIA